jgi:hypothetical protein
MAKRHPLLAEVSAAVNGEVPRESVKIGKFEFTLEAPSAEGEEWANAQSKGESLAATMLSMRTPSVAVSLRAINNVPVEQLFEPGDDMDKDVKTLMLKEPRAMRRWLWAAVYDWLLVECNPAVVDALYKVYSGLAQKQREVLKALPDF